MKLFVSISNYGDSQLHYLSQVIDEYKSYKKYDVTLHVDSTVPIGRNDVEVELYDPSVRNLLACAHRAEMIDRKNDYDLFLYGENDMLIKESAVDTFLAYQPDFSINQCLGFIRYEVRENNPELYFPDINSYWPTIKQKHIEHRGKRFFQFHNVHQGCWLLTKEQLDYAINKPEFTLGAFNEISPTSPGILESGASSLFCGWERGVITKFLTENPEDLRKCLIHHMSNKYCRLDQPIWKDQPGPMTFNQLVEELKK